LRGGLTADGSLVEPLGAFEPILSGVRACEAVVFDLDDTLYLERDYVRSGARAAARWVAAQTEADPDEAERELLAQISRSIRRDPFGRWLRRRSLDPRVWLPRMLDVYRSHRPGIELGIGVQRLLERLARKHKLGLLTDGRLEQQRRKVEALRLERWPFAIVYSDEWGRQGWKPDLRPYQTVLERLGVPAERSVYVGDNPAKDFLGARRAGMLSIRFRRRGGLHAHTQPGCSENAPDWETTTVYELERVLTGQKRPQTVSAASSSGREDREIGGLASAP